MFKFEFYNELLVVGDRAKTSFLSLSHRKGVRLRKNKVNRVFHLLFFRDILKEYLKNKLKKYKFNFFSDIIIMQF
ncbi:hypothetical protein DMB92_06055 [Campylobacter sp. MIT 99-7217]|nr:hypothetical protein DMB92_06055 [Campylobacter sp. MIT 99-7217]